MREIGKKRDAQKIFWHNVYGGDEKMGRRRALEN
jgi:hypothetical protein